ncbi:MAG: DUF3489 domain-containing protein, partial [Alphaproteobacteria bacterium]
EDLNLSGGALSRTLGVLAKKGIAEKDDDGHWRITDAGRSAAGAPAPEQETRAAPKPSAGRTGSKQARLVELLRRPEGAAIADIQVETGWQAHSVRGAISGVCKKKLGLNVVSAVEEGRGRVYRIAAEA